MKTKSRAVALATLLALTLAGCDLFGGDDPGGSVSVPEITSFTANPTVITSPGQQVTLSWQLSGAVTSLTLEPGGAAVTGSSTTVAPTQTTTYTLRARNSAGEDDAQATVTLDDGTGTPPGPDPDPPTGNFAVGSSANGPFTNDRGEGVQSPNDERVLRVDPGDSFFAQVSYSDPSGIANIAVNLVNSSPPGIAGTLNPGQNVSGFTLVGAVNSGCDLSGAPTSVTCVYQIEVDDDVDNIDALPGAGDEFAYVFRTRVTDSVGNESNEAIRGYVVVGEANTAPPEPPEEPAPPEPEPPEEPAPPEPPEEPEPPIVSTVIESFTANGDADETTVAAGTEVTLEWTLSGPEPEALSLLVEEEGIGTPGTPIELDADATSYETEELTVTTTFTLVVAGPDGTEPAQGVVTVTVMDEAP